MSSLRFPAEFDRQDQLWIGWPKHDPTLELSAKEAVARLAAACSESVEVVMPAQSSAEAAEIRKHLLHQGVTLSQSERISIPLIDYELCWLKDFTPLVALDAQGSGKALAFQFNLWGSQDPGMPLAQQHTFFFKHFLKGRHIDHLLSPFIFEGGNIESNGAGLAIVCEAVFTQRNPTVGKDEFALLLEKELGIKKIVWLPEGLIEDDLPSSEYVRAHSSQFLTTTTGGHVDEFCRFADRHTVLLAEVPVEEEGTWYGQENKRRLDRAYEALVDYQDESGHSLNIIRVPTAPFVSVGIEPTDTQYMITLENYENFGCPQSQDLSRPIQLIAAASYLNFVICNGTVVVPMYDDKTRNRQALKAIQQAFSNYRIVELNPLALNVDGGGFHCITQYFPSSQT